MNALRRLLLPLVVLVALAGLTGCGSSTPSATGDADPADWAPAGAPVYIEMSIRPGEPLKSSVDSVASKVSLRKDWRAQLIAKINSSSKKGATFEKDIDPWLGNRAGVFFSGPIVGRKPLYALIVGVRDEKKLKDEISSRRLADRPGAHPQTYKGVSFTVAPNGNAIGVVKGSLVIASEPSIQKIIDVSKGAPSLSSDAAFGKAKSRVAAQRLSLMYFDLKRLLDLAPQGGTNSAQLQQLKALPGIANAKPVAVALAATPNSITLDSSVERAPGTPAATGRRTPLFDTLPADSWVAAGVGGLGEQIKRTLATLAGAGGPGASIAQIESLVRARTGLDLQKDLLGWIGDAAFFVHGTSTSSIGGALVLSSKDPAVSTRAVGRIGKAVAQLSHRPTKTVSVAGAKGFSAPTKSGRQPLVMVARGDRVVIAYGTSSAQAALQPSGRLGDSGELKGAKSALGSGLDPSLYVSVAPILKLVESAGGSAKLQQALPYLRAYRYIVAGSKRSGDVSNSRLIVGLR
jgi:hypothetical protein